MKDLAVRRGFRKGARRWIVGVGAIALAGAGAAQAPAVRMLFAEGAAQAWQPQMDFPDPSGSLRVLTIGPAFDTATHPFFRPAANGRACVTCHQPSDGMALSAASAQQRWAANGPSDPLFDVSDGANCPNLPRAARESHSLLLDRGLIRVALPWPPRPRSYGAIDPEFTLEVLRDPTGCNNDKAFGMAAGFVSVYRRPRVVANVRFLERAKFWVNFKNMLPFERDADTGARSSMSFMSDARATSLANAMTGHAGMQGRFSAEEVEQLAAFVRSVFVAQQRSDRAGPLDEAGAPPGLTPRAMVTGRTHIEGTALDAKPFLSFAAWNPGGKAAGKDAGQAAFRASVARGADLFENRTFFIRNAVGINNIGLGNPFKQTCAFCHNTQLTGHDSVPGWMDLGTNTMPHAIDDAQLPLFKITCKPAAKPHPFLGRVIFTHDPGRALVSGQCLDVGGTTMQQFRGIAARAPYFTNGSAASLTELVDFYDRRFNIKFTKQEREDLVNFLGVL